MPTGSTTGLYAGTRIGFEAFVLKCAQELSPYEAHDPIARNRYEAELRVARTKVAAIERWDVEEADIQAQSDYEQRCDAYREELRKRRAVRRSYEAMLRRVKAWTPPSAQHQRLKDYMINQLQQSIDADCNTKNLTKPQRLSGAVYKEQQLQTLEIYIASVTAVRESEISRATARRDWHLALRRSLSESTLMVDAS